MSHNQTSTQQQFHNFLIHHPFIRIILAITIYIYFVISTSYAAIAMLLLAVEHSVSTSTGSPFIDVLLFIPIPLIIAFGLRESLNSIVKHLLLA